MIIILVNFCAWLLPAEFTLISLFYVIQAACLLAQHFTLNWWFHYKTTWGLLPGICASNHCSSSGCRVREVHAASLYGMPVIGLCMTYYSTMFDLPNVALIDLYVHPTTWSGLWVPCVEVSDGMVNYC